MLSVNLATDIVIASYSSIKRDYLSNLQLMGLILSGRIPY